jgi:hypothetical protein
MPIQLACLRCQEPLKYHGPRFLHEGMKAFDEVLFHKMTLNRLALDVYSCPRYGKVEFFEDGVGDRSRGEPV